MPLYYSDEEIQRLEDALLRFFPSRQWELKRVTFPSTANQVLDIAHGLTTSHPGKIQWLVVQASSPCFVYQPRTELFLESVVKLACTQPSAEALIVLMVSEDVGQAPLVEAELNPGLAGFVPDQFHLTAANKSVFLTTLGGSLAALDSGWTGPGLAFKDSTVGEWYITYGSGGGISDHGLAFTDKGNNVVPLLIRKFGDYYIMPAPNASNAEDIYLGSNLESSNRGRWRNVYAHDMNSLNGYTEQGRSAANGIWQTYTPTWTGAVSNPAIGNGLLSGRYFYGPGKTVTLHVVMSAGSTTTFGSGGWSFSLPVNAVSGASNIGPTRMVDSGTAFHSGIVHIGTTSTVVIEPHGAANNAGSLVPFTWASGDTLVFSLTYEID